jgi:predicted nucleic acid-binding protein
MRMPVGSRRDRLRTWVKEALPARFSGRILSIDAEIAALWGVMLAEAERRGDTLPVIDSLIAATAALHDFTVATRNEDDFRRCSVPVINPWKTADR